MGNERRVPVLNFDTMNREGMLFRIDGQDYETVPPEMYGPRDISKIRKHQRVIEDFGNKMRTDGKTVSDKERDEYRKASLEIGRMIAPEVPEDVFDRLSDTEIQRLVVAFMGAVNETTQVPGRNGRSPQSPDDSTESTSANSSLDYDASTEETIESGSD